MLLRKKYYFQEDFFGEKDLSMLDTWVFDK